MLVTVKNTLVVVSTKRNLLDTINTRLSPLSFNQDIEGLSGNPT